MFDQYYTQKYKYDLQQHTSIIFLVQQHRSPNISSVRQ